MSHPVWICVAAWFVPGAGHLLLKKWGRGIAFFAVIMVLFVCGLAMEGRLFGFSPGFFRASQVYCRRRCWISLFFGKADGLGRGQCSRLRIRVWEHFSVHSRPTQYALGGGCFRYCPGSKTVNHYIAISILSVCITTVFTLITKETKEERIRYFLKLLGYMVVGSFVVAWIMYSVP